MRILLLIETLSAGGAETFVIRLANALVERGHEVVLAVMHGHRIEPGLAAQIDERVRVEALRLPAERWLWRIDGVLRRLRIDVAAIRLLQRRWLRRVIARWRPEVVHSHLLKADRLAAQVRAAMRPVPAHVITLHGDYAPYVQGHADPLMLHGPRWMARVLGQADAVVAVCRQHVAHLREDLPGTEGRLHLIYNGYALPERSADAPVLPTDKFLFGMVSRGVEQKGWSVAVEAFRRLGRDDAALVLVGEGPAIERLRKEAPPGVIFAGFAARPTDWIAVFDVCLLPTLFPHESLPTAVIEYLACGRPVIATDVGEIGAMLRAPDGSTAGVLLGFQDGKVSVDELARAMQRMMDDPAQRTAMTESARAAFPKFAMERCVAAYEALYRELVSPSSSSTSANH